MLRFVTSSPKEWRWKNRKRGELSHICDCEHAAAEKMTDDGSCEPNSQTVFIFWIIRTNDFRTKE